MDVEATPPKVCSHFGKLKKKDLALLLEEWAKGGSCYRKHSQMASQHDASLRISLVDYHLGCARDTDHKCMVKDYEKDHDKCLTLNPVDGSIWQNWLNRCYECDSDFQELRDMYELENGDCSKPEFKNMLEFQDSISDIYTEFKTKLFSQTSQSQSMDDQSSSSLAKSTRIPSHVFGIHNIGNTCFFNSTMQAMNATRELVDFYVSNQDMFEEHDQLLMCRLEITRHI